MSCEFEGIDAFLSGTAGTPAFMAPEALTGLCFPFELGSFTAKQTTMKACHLVIGLRISKAVAATTLPG